MKDPYAENCSRNINENSADAVTTFCSKVVTKVVTNTVKVTTTDKPNKNNNLQQSVKWIGRVEGGNLLGISKIAMLKHISKGHFVTRRVKMNGGFGYEIALESMFNYYNSIGDWAKCEKILGMMQELSTIEGKTTDRASSVPTITTDMALAKFQICKLLDEVILKADKKTIALERFVNSFNQGSYPGLLENVGRISVRTVYRWYRDLRDNNWDISVFEKELKPTARSISNKEAEILIPMIINPNRPLVSEILKRAKQEFLNRGITIKSDVTYRRFIEDWTRRNIDLWTLGRFGMKAYNDKIMKDILRDKDRVEVGDIVVADGHTLNVMVINPLTGRPQRMTLIMFFDFKSSMPLGWEIMPTENVLTIASALRRTILLLGRFFGNNSEAGSFGYIPRIAYLDNGRAFRAKYFRGIKDFRDSIVPGLFGKLGIETMYATPYHGQSKTIERWFKTLGELERRLPAYTGTNIAGKPAMLMRNEKLHQRLFDNTPITIDSLEATLQEYVKEYAEQPHQDGQYKGLCPAEVFMHSVSKIKSESERLEGRLISKSELNYLMLSDETRTITKNGIRFRGNYYYNEEMPRIIGSRVMVKYDIWDDKDIIVLDEKERYLFSASKDDVRYHPAARLLGTDEDIVLLQEALRKKQQMKNETMEQFKEIVKLGNELIPKKQVDVFEMPKKEEKKQPKKKNAFKEYMKLCGIEAKIYKNPVEALLKKG